MSRSKNGQITKARKETLSREAEMILSPNAGEVVKRLNELLSGVLELTAAGGSIEARLVSPEAALVMRDVYPIRPALCAELRRLALWCQVQADAVADLDDVGDEDNAGYADEWRKCFAPAGMFGGEAAPVAADR